MRTLLRSLGVLLSFLVTAPIAVAGGAASAPVLGPRSVGPVAFGLSPRTAVDRLGTLFGPAISHRTLREDCGVTEEVSWRSLSLFFDKGRLVGYGYRPSGGYGFGAGRGAETEAVGLGGYRVGESLSLARRHGGIAFRTSGNQNGTWRARVGAGVLKGYLSDLPNRPDATLATIGAGLVGCPAVSP